MMLAIIAGVILRASPALDIIHELMHYGFCNASGIEVIKLNWSSIVYARSSLTVLYGGYYGEMVLYSILALCFYKVRLGGVFVGILLVVYFASFGSMDFNEYALKAYGDPAKVTAGLIRWGIMSTAAMGVVIGTYYHSQKKEKRV